MLKSTLRLVAYDTTRGTSGWAVAASTATMAATAAVNSHRIGALVADTNGNDRIVDLTDVGDGYQTIKAVLEAGDEAVELMGSGKGFFFFFCCCSFRNVFRCLVCHIAMSQVYGVGPFPDRIVPLTRSTFIAIATIAGF